MPHGGHHDNTTVDKDGDGTAWWNDSDEARGDSISREEFFESLPIGTGGGGLSDLLDHAEDLISFITNPAPTIRGVVSGILLSGVASILEVTLDTILLVLVGSNPTEFAADGEVYGVADFPVALARIAGDAAATPFDLVVTVVADLIEQTTPASEGPAEGLAMSVVIAGVLYVILRYGPIVLERLVRALVSTIPTVGVPIAELIDRE